MNVLMNAPIDPAARTTFTDLIVSVRERGPAVSPLLIGDRWGSTTQGTQAQGIDVE
jgi:hypothetical protein